MYYRLNKAETVPVTLYHVAKSKVIGGKKVVTYNNFIRLALVKNMRPMTKQCLHGFQSTSGRSDGRRR